jgi:hypothetical protein
MNPSLATWMASDSEIWQHKQGEGRSEGVVDRSCAQLVFCLCGSVAGWPVPGTSGTTGQLLISVPVASGARLETYRAALEGCWHLCVLLICTAL